MAGEFYHSFLLLCFGTILLLFPLQLPSDIAITYLGYTVAVTTVLSGAEYFSTYISAKKEIECSKRRPPPSN
jgi:hypothetical protein